MRSLARARIVLGVLVVASMSMSATLAFADASCDAVYDAGIRQIETPHHIYTTQSEHAGHAAQTSETIFAGGVEYMQLDGRWQRSPLSAAELLADAKKKRAAATPDETCRRLGEEKIGDATAIVYQLHDENGVDSKLWIATPGGALLRQTITLPDRSTIENRYEYANVQAPAGAR